MFNPHFSPECFFKHNSWNTFFACITTLNFSLEMQNKSDTFISNLLHSLLLHCMHIYNFICISAKSKEEPIHIFYNVSLTDKVEWNRRLKIIQFLVILHYRRICKSGANYEAIINLVERSFVQIKLLLICRTQTSIFIIKTKSQSILFKANSSTQKRDNFTEIQIKINKLLLSKFTTTSFVVK